jgi:hypothetical protein
VDKEGINNLLAPMQSKILYVKGTKKKKGFFPLKKPSFYFYFDKGG